MPSWYCAGRGLIMTTKKQKIKKRKKKVLRPIKTKKVRTKEEVRKTKIRLIGVGGGGSSIVSEIASRMKKADFVAANTDSRALRKVAKKVKRFQFGQDLTQGLGTGMNVEIGEMAAQNEKEKIKKLFEEQDVCIIVACLGGGTGSGAVPVFAKISKNLSCLSYGIFTLPFKFEGEKKMEIARESLGKIKSHLNAYSVIPNERIFQIVDKNAPLKNALSAINQKLAGNLEGLIEMIYLPGLINIDFADLKTILTGRARLAYLNSIEVKAPNKEEAVKKVISSPLYPYTTKGAKRVLYNITGGRALQLSEVSQISKIISQSISKKAKIIFGINQNQKLQDKIKITLLAVGCGLKGLLIYPVKSPKVRPSHSAKGRVSNRVHPVRYPKGGISPKAKLFNIVEPSQVVKSPILGTKKPKARAVSQQKEKVVEDKPPTTFQGKVVGGKTKKSPQTKQGQPDSGGKIGKASPRSGVGVKKTKPKPKPKKKPKGEKSLRGQKKQARLKVAKAEKKSKVSEPPTLLKKVGDKPLTGQTPNKILKKPGEEKTPPTFSAEKVGGKLEKEKPLDYQELGHEKVRRTGLQLKKAVEEEEKEILEKEKIWQTPAIFRREKFKASKKSSSF